MTKITYIPGEIANAAIDEHGNRKPVTMTQTKTIRFGSSMVNPTSGEISQGY